MSLSWLHLRHRKLGPYLRQHTGHCHIKGTLEPVGRQEVARRAGGGAVLRDSPLARLWEGAITSPQAMEGLRWDVSQEISYKAHSDC